METAAQVFRTLNAINCNEHTEKKNGLTYLSWSWAWTEVKMRYPLATYTIYENADGLNYHHDGRTCWVKTGVTIEGIEYIEYLPVMNFQNKSIPLGQVTSYDVNKAIQRSLTKALARHGLGLYIYAGEDLPEGKITNSTVRPVGTDPASYGARPTPAPEPVQSYTPCSEEMYWKFVRGHAAGQTCKSGASLRDYWIRATHADHEAIEIFDLDVADAMEAMGITSSNQ